MSNESTSTEPQPLFAKKPKPAGEKKEGGNSKTGLIVGICCGAGAFIILIVVLIVVLVVNGGGNTVSCENTKDYGNGNTQKGGVKVSFDKEDKLTGIYAWEETHTDEVISESEWESFEKDSQNYDKDKYLKGDGTWGTVSASDINVAQSVVSTDSNDYELIFSGTADNTTRTEGVGKNNTLKCNPSTGNISVSSVTISGTVTNNTDAATKQYVDNLIDTAITQVIEAGY